MFSHNVKVLRKRLPSLWLTIGVYLENYENKQYSIFIYTRKAAKNSLKQTFDFYCNFLEISKKERLQNVLNLISKQNS